MVLQKCQVSINWSIYSTKSCCDSGGNWRGTAATCRETRRPRTTKPGTRWPHGQHRRASLGRPRRRGGAYPRARTARARGPVGEEGTTADRVPVRRGPDACGAEGVPDLYFGRNTNQFQRNYISELQNPNDKSAKWHRRIFSQHSGKEDDSFPTVNNFLKTTD